MSKIIEYEKKLNTFDYDGYLSSGNYQMASALAALRITNDIQKSFLKKEANLTEDDYALRLYALLQALFVSIDSLYAIAYSLTKSKSFININKNPDLRTLKYIRNDVVGHPSNRVLGSDVLAYCILDKKSITKEFFSYKIYSLNNVEEKTINISHILDSYFDEANDLLDSLAKISGITVADNILEDKITKVLDSFNKNEKYRPYLNEFINEYKNQYKDLTDQHRILWRYNLINKLFKELSNDSYLNEIIEYCIGLEIGKIYKLIFNLSYDIEIKRIIPEGISSLYRFLNKNPKVISILEYLKDIESPLFKYGLDLLEAEAERKSSMKFKRYIKLIKDAYNNKESDLVYAYTLPIRMYNKK